MQNLNAAFGGVRRKQEVTNQTLKDIGPIATSVAKHAKRGSRYQPTVHVPALSSGAACGTACDTAWGIAWSTAP